MRLDRLLQSIRASTTNPARTLISTQHSIPQRPLTHLPSAAMSDLKPAVPTSEPHPWPRPQDWPAAKVRKTFIEYFQNQPGFEHTFWPSSGVIPFEDDTLLFANAGMNQYKPLFLGTADPKSDLSKLIRAVNSQKCIRAGGKHNDLDDVGKDTYHHTFFEMLGNWSFGNYFKLGALTMAWDLLTRVYGLPKDRLYVTYFEGDAKQGLGPDLEARQIWLDIGLPESHVLTGDAKDNFWEMGATGPCGPSSEIHFDRIGNRNAAQLVNQDDPTVIEIWNNVFIQYNREPSGSLRPLPLKHVDTGLGFERLVSCLHDVSSNYDTDCFTPIFSKIQELTGARPYTGKLGDEDADGFDTAYRVVADHSRTLTIAMSDGGVPDKDGRGYVLRRILRRGTRYASDKLGAKPGKFFSSLLPTTVDTLSPIFPEVTKKIPEIAEILDEEEASFARTLHRGEALFSKYAAAAAKENRTVLNGKDAWRLYDTFGFPVDLTQIMAEERGLTIDQEAFDIARLESLEASKAGGKSAGGVGVKLDVHDLATLEANADVPKTDDSFKYQLDDVKSTVKAIYQTSDFSTSTANVKGSFGIIMDKTNFYAEQGGQENDTGVLSIDGKAEFKVEDVQVYNGYVLHIGQMEEGEIRVGDEVIATYDEDRRWPIRNNHTGTHILNFALREVLGDHIDQKGSLVAPNRLRFDFSHNKSIFPAELAQIESISNEWVKKAAPVYAREMSLQEAYKIPGLRAVFGEAYPDPVRVVSIGYPLEDIQKNIEDSKWRSTSIEFCGGTHVAKTDDIKDFVITEESSIAKGIRRIVAVTGFEANEVSRKAKDYEARLERADAMQGKEKDAALKAFYTELVQSNISLIRKQQLKDKYEKIQGDIQAVVRAREKADQKMITEEVQRFFTENPNENVFVGVFGLGANGKLLSAATTVGRTQGKAIYVFSTDVESSKVAHTNYVPKDVVKKLDAKTWLGEVSEIIGGKGGGKEDNATGVGNEIEKVTEAAEAAKRFYKSKVEGM